MFAADIETLLTTLQEASPAGLGVGFLTGLYLLSDYVINHH